VSDLDREGKQYRHSKTVGPPPISAFPSTPLRATNRLVLSAKSHHL
jgi:hypothetical protein